MTESTLVEPRSSLRKLAARFGEPESLERLRADALAAYLESPLPSRVEHLWRYTDPAKFAPADATLARVEPPQGAAPDCTHLLEALEAGAIAGAVVTGGDGEATPKLAPELASQGVVLMDLHRAWREKGDAVARALGSLVGGRNSIGVSGKFESLNLALWRSGTFVHVPRNVRVELPVHVLHAIPATNTPEFLAARLLVVVEEGAELTIIDEYVGGGPGTAANAAVELIAGQASRLRFVSVQRLHPRATWYVTQRASVARDARLLAATASLGAALTKSDFGSILTGPGANVELFGFLFGEEKQRFDHHTVHDHRAPHTASNLDFKVVLKGKAQSAYTGLIRIEPDAPQSEAYQENRNLLLAEGARAESIPELEILTDDVRCTHGATVGTLDPEHLFYLASRGLERNDAIRLIVGGFVEPTLSRLPEDLRERLRQHVEERIEDI